MLSSPHGYGRNAGYSEVLKSKLYNSITWAICVPVGAVLINKVGFETNLGFVVDSFRVLIWKYILN